MNDRFDFDSTPPESKVPPSAVRRSAIRWSFPGDGMLRQQRSVAALLVVMGVCLVYGLHLHKVRETRRQARLELKGLLEAGKPDTASLLGAFDRSTEDVVFAAAGPYFIVAVTVIFLVGQTLSVKHRLAVIERLVANRPSWHP